jgi:hypothetical protein
MTRKRILAALTVWALVCGGAGLAHAAPGPLVVLKNNSGSAMVQVFIATTPGSCSNVSWHGRVESGGTLALRIGFACRIKSYQLWSYADQHALVYSPSFGEQAARFGKLTFNYYAPHKLKLE